jgi:pimeloyl-ACP methyl ester carboxylesterase
VLFRGGFGFDSRARQPQFDDLTDEFTVIAWDAPGCGGSEERLDVACRNATWAWVG